MCCPARTKKEFLRVSISRRRYIILACIPFVFILGTWSALSAFHQVPAVFLPSAVGVGKALWASFLSGELLSNIWTSTRRVMFGFLLGAGLAVPIGVALGNLIPVEALLLPVMEFLRYLPVPSLLPLCILWFGIGETEKVVVIFLGTFFQLVVLVCDAARAVPNHYLEIGYTLGLGRVESLWKIVLPSSSPAIFNSLRVSFGWAWSYVVVAEIVAADHGLGFMIMESERYADTAEVIGGIVMIGVLGLISDLLFRAAARVLFPFKDAIA